VLPAGRDRVLDVGLGRGFVLHLDRLEEGLLVFGLEDLDVAGGVRVLVSDVHVVDLDVHVLAAGEEVLGVEDAGGDGRESLAGVRLGQVFANDVDESEVGHVGRVRVTDRRRLELGDLVERLPEHVHRIEFIRRRLLFEIRQDADHGLIEVVVPDLVVGVEFGLSVVDAVRSRFVRAAEALAVVLLPVGDDVGRQSAGVERPVEIAAVLER